MAAQSKMVCSDVQQHINLQNAIIEYWMTKAKTIINTLKNGSRRLKDISYEASKAQLEFFQAISTVCAQQKAKALADHLFKGSWPKDQKLGWFVQFYAAMFKRL